MEFAQSLEQPGQVVGGGDGDGAVIMFVVLGFCFGAIQGRQEVFLQNSIVTDSSVRTFRDSTQC